MDTATKRAVILAIIPKVSATLSMIGSGWIVLEVATNASKRKNVYHRLLLAMAVYDILESIFNFFSSWPIPRGTPNIFAAVGTTATCVTQGFFLQLGLAIPICTYGSVLVCGWMFVFPVADVCVCVATSPVEERMEVTTCRVFCTQADSCICFNQQSNL